MNVSSSIFTAPITINDTGNAESPSPTLGKRPRDLTRGASNPPRSAPWPNHRSELLQQVNERKKRASSRVSPHRSAAAGPPHSEKIDRRHRSRQDSHNPQDHSPPGPSTLPHQSSQRPSLPYRLSSAEAGAKMLSKANKEDAGSFRTLKLARASVSSPSRPSAQRTPSGSGRHHLTSKPKSPANAEKPNGLNALSQIGVLELLEQDDRPTFIIDLDDHTNYGPGLLKLVFANNLLKASAPVLDMITGRAGQESPGLAAATLFTDFKAWSMSYVRNHESLDVTLPSFSYAGSIWTSCSLRKRFRVIKASPALSRANIEHHPLSIGLLLTPSRGGKENDGPIEDEAQDYFGNVTNDLRPGTDTSRTNDQDGARGQRSLTEASPGLPHLGIRGAESVLRAVSAGDLDQVSMAPQAGTRVFDWTRLPDSPLLPPHIRFTRSIEWPLTALGPIEGWPTELRTMCNLIMASPHPAAVYWGPSLIGIYNEAYILLAGQKHPRMMGQSYREAWAEIWDSVEDDFRDAMTTGRPAMKDDDCLFINRAVEDGHLEETYFSWSLIPIVGEDGSVVGLYNPAFENTRRKVAERRMLTLREIGEKTASARDLKRFWQQCLDGLQYNEYDSPFVLLYSVTDDLDSASSSLHPNSNMNVKQCNLEGSLGVPAGHPAAAPNVNLRSETEFFARVFRAAAKSDQPMFLSTENDTLDAKLLEGIEWRGFGDPCKAAVCCPIHLTGGASTLGFLVMGVNPRRPYDDDYSLYVQLLSRQLATAMASVVLFEEEIARGKRAAQLAAQDRSDLSEQLDLRTREALDSETKFTRMAGSAPVGIFIADYKGKLTYVNEKWYDISRVPEGFEGTDEWLDSIQEEDQGKMRQLWSDLVNNGVALNTEVRFRTTWTDQNGNKADTWVLASAFPEIGEDGRVNVIFGSITDISQQKWAEYFEKRRMEEAVEMKRQQENFIDITSHEMRNPLSAILQCADEIHTSLTELQTNDVPQGVTGELVRNAIDASGIIALCAQHQKRIVDDILTLSKLDSALLLVTPCDILPQAVVQQALKMFDGEMQTADIDLNFNVDNSVARLGVEWVKLDPSRLLQVLINLTTNAIKFTTNQEKRIINVTMGASLERPAKEGNLVSYFPPRSKRKDLTTSSDWGSGETVYLHFAVQDTGRGLSNDEKKLLFIRFSQTSPQTHIQYGGSGLGLFISRELVELQGGEIGVASEAGEGSTFAFYIKARRSTKPKDDMDQFHSAGARKSSASKHPIPAHLKAPRQKSEGSPTSQNSLPQRPASKSPLKILVVEDNLVNQKVLSKQLRNMGCVVHVANHGGECLERLRASTFWKANKGTGIEISVILMDQEMPVMDGLTCTKEIRKLEAKGEVACHVPIISVTANARSEQIDTAMDGGMVRTADAGLSSKMSADVMTPGRRRLQTIPHRRPHPQGRRVDGEVPIPHRQRWSWWRPSAAMTAERLFCSTDGTRATSISFLVTQSTHFFHESMALGVGTGVRDRRLNDWFFSVGIGQDSIALYALMGVYSTMLIGYRYLLSFE